MKVYKVIYDKKALPDIFSKWKYIKLYQIYKFKMEVHKAISNIQIQNGSS